MLKKNKGKIILSSLVILLPLLIGLIIWNQLPESIPIHWNLEGEIDGYESRGFVVLGMPLLLLALHWIALLATSVDPKNTNYSGKMFGLVLCIIPAISLLMCVICFSSALGVKLEVDVIIPIFMGILFILIGNWLPKCKQNYSLGVRVSWALEDEGNWRYTHRIAGLVWVIGGVCMVAVALLSFPWLIFVCMIPMIIIPVIASYSYYKKHKKEQA